MGISIEGDQEVQKQLNELAEHIVQALPDALMSSVSVIKNAAKENAPVRTGALRDSIRSDPESTPTEVRIEVGPTVDYADDVEFGGARRDAQPFLRNAADENEELVLKLLADELSSILENVS